MQSEASRNSSRDRLFAATLDELRYTNGQLLAAHAAREAELEQAVNERTATILEEAGEQLKRLDEEVASLLERNLQLQQALDSRVVIEQAKGILVERYRIGTDEAFDLLRRSSRNQRMRIHALAAAVVSSHETPVEIAPPRADRPP